MLYVIPIEPLEERYSKQWSYWTRKFLYEHGMGGKYETIDPMGAYKVIENGAFLDVIGTHEYKNTQMRIILDKFRNKQIKDEDIFWFHDMWFPGIETLAYIRDAFGMKFKIYGCLHAGTYDPYDYLTQKGMRPWGAPLEEAWFELMDGIFVATNFHKEMIIENRNVEKIKIHVTGFPIYSDFVPKEMPEKENIVVFPHRLDKEKNPEMFDKMESEFYDTSTTLWRKYNFRFLKTKEVCETKKEYYELLSRAKFAVSFAAQETWGIAMQEAVMCGCIPIVPDRLAYKEMYPDAFQIIDRLCVSFEMLSEPTKAVYLLIYLSNDYPKYKHLADQLKRKFIDDGANAFPNMLNIMGYCV